MFAIRVTPRAESDLVVTWLYTCETWGAEQADRYLDQLEAGLMHLAGHPLLGFDYSHIRADYRKLRIQRHDVFYRVLESEILIVRVLHQDMDTPLRLAD